MLCINLKDIKECNMIQKKIDLDSILSHVKDFSTKYDALKESYIPFDFCFSVRTIYTNLVLKLQDGKYYIHLKDLDIHGIPLSYIRSDELIAYFSKVALMKIIDYSKNFDLIIRDTMLQNIGFYNPDSFRINPIFYTHLIIRDEIVSEFNKYLKSYIKFVSIDSVENSFVFKDSLIIV